MAAVWRTNEVRVACPQEGARLSLVSHSVGDTCQSHRHGWVCILALFISGENIHFLSVAVSVWVSSLSRIPSGLFTFILAGKDNERIYYLFIFTRDFVWGVHFTSIPKNLPNIKIHSSRSDYSSLPLSSRELIAALPPMQTEEAAIIVEAAQLGKSSPSWQVNQKRSITPAAPPAPPQSLIGS